MTKVAVLVGSLRAESFNKKLAKNIELVAPDDVTFEYADIGNLPLFNEDLESDFPASAQQLKDLIESADGVLFVTPEYNRSISGVLKNAIDWASRPWGSNSFDGKPVAIAGASLSPLGTAAAQDGLKSILVYLNMKLVGQPELYVPLATGVFDDEGSVNDEMEEKLRAFIQNLCNNI